MFQRPHLAWVAEHGPRARTAAYYLKDAGDPPTLLPYVKDLSDLSLRGLFHESLALSGDPTQLEAMSAYLASLSYGADTEGPKVVKSMLALDKERGLAELVGLYDRSLTEGQPTRAEEVAGWLEASASPEDLARWVTRIEVPARRGRFYKALATTKDPQHVDAILAYAETVVPTDPGAARPEAWAPLVESLGAFGDVARPRLQAALEQTASRSLVSLAAEALRDADLPFLVKHAQALLDEYDQGVPRLARDARLVDLIDEGGELPEGIEQEEVAAARERLHAASARAYMIFEVLRALEQIKGDQSVDFCVVRGLSSFDREIAEWSALRIKERLAPDQLVDTLFSYMAQKNQFAVAEVNVYEGLLDELGAAGAARVATNLDRLLTASNGDPEEVFWLYKKMGIKLLGAHGGPDALPVLQKYAADTGSYVISTVKTSSSGEKTREEEEVRYVDEVKAAVRAIRERAAGGDPSGDDPSGEGE